MFFFLLLIVVGCSNDSEEVINDFKKELDEVSEISQIKSAFESKGFKSVEEAAAYANSLIQDIKPISRAINEDDYVERISPEVMEVIESMKNIKVDTEASPETLRFQLKEIVQNSTLSSNSQEYNILMNSVDIAVEAIYYAMELEAPKDTVEEIGGSNHVLFERYLQEVINISMDNLERVRLVVQELVLSHYLLSVQYRESL